MKHIEQAALSRLSETAGPRKGSGSIKVLTPAQVDDEANKLVTSIISKLETAGLTVSFGSAAQDKPTSSLEFADLGNWLAVQLQVSTHDLPASKKLDKDAVDRSYDMTIYTNTLSLSEGRQLGTAPTSLPKYMAADADSTKYAAVIIRCPDAGGSPSLAADEAPSTSQGKPGKLSTSIINSLAKDVLYYITSGYVVKRS